MSNCICQLTLHLLLYQHKVSKASGCSLLRGHFITHRIFRGHQLRRGAYKQQCLYWHRTERNRVLMLRWCELASNEYILHIYQTCPLSLPHPLQRREMASSHASTAVLTLTVHKPCQGHAWYGTSNINPRVLPTKGLQPGLERWWQFTAVGMPITTKPQTRWCKV